MRIFILVSDRVLTGKEEKLNEELEEVTMSET